MAQGESAQVSPAMRISLVAVGASAGGLQSLLPLLKGLPGVLGAAIIVAVHRSGRYVSHLDAILQRVSLLPVAEAVHGEAVRSDRIYLAPAGADLVVSNRRLEIHQCPGQARYRPSIDRLFDSVASDYGQGSAAVLLSGLLDDGVDGLAAVAGAGGVTIVEDPKECAYPQMSRAALARDRVVYCLGVTDIASLLIQLCRQGSDGQTTSA